jgi:hypothetical protein
MSEHPTREQALAALTKLTDLLAEFSFIGPIDRAVALSGLLTALVRGSLTTAPMYLIHAHTPGTGFPSGFSAWGSSSRRRSGLFGHSGSRRAFDVKVVKTAQTTFSD